MNVSEWWGRLRAVTTLHEVSPERAETLVMGALSKDLVDQLYGFGTLLVNEVMSRTAQLDAKAIRLVGWASAALGFMLLFSSPETPSPAWQRIALWALTGAAALLALLASAHAVFALRIREWEMPSESDWFRGELFAEPMKLRVYHLLALLETHRNHNFRNAIKGEHVQRSQWFLVGASILIAIIVVIRQV